MKCKVFDVLVHYSGDWAQGALDWNWWLNIFWCARENKDATLAEASRGSSIGNFKEGMIRAAASYHYLSVGYSCYVSASLCPNFFEYMYLVKPLLTDFIETLLFVKAHP